MNKSLNTAVATLVAAYQEYKLQAFGNSLSLAENDSISDKLSTLVDICEKKTQELPPLKNFLEEYLEVLALMSPSQCLHILHTMAKDIPRTTEIFKEDDAKLLLFIAKILENNYQLEQHPLIGDFIYERLIANKPYNTLLTAEAQLNLGLKLAYLYDRYIANQPDSPQKQRLVLRRKNILTAFLKAQKQFNIELRCENLSIDTQAKLAVFSIGVLSSLFQTKNTTYFDDLFNIHQNISRILFHLTEHKSILFRTMLKKHKIRTSNLEEFSLSITEAFEQPQQASPLVEEYFLHLKKLAKIGILIKGLINEISLLYAELAPGLINELPLISNLEKRIGKTKDLLYLDLARHVSYLLFCHLSPENFYGAYDKEKYDSLMIALDAYMNAASAFHKNSNNSPVLEAYSKQIFAFLNLINAFAPQRKTSETIEISPPIEVCCQSLVLQNPEVFLQMIEAIEANFESHRIKGQQKEDEIRALADRLPEPKRKASETKTKEQQTTTSLPAPTKEDSEFPAQKKKEKQRDPKWLKTMKNTGNWFTTYNTINSYLIRSTASIQRGKYKTALSILEQAQAIFINHNSQLNSISEKNFYIYLLICRFEVESLILSTLLKKTTRYIKKIDKVTAQDNFIYDNQLLTKLGRAFQNTESSLMTIRDYFGLNGVTEELTTIYDLFNSMVDNFTHKFENTVKHYKEAHDHLELKLIKLELERLQIIKKMGWKAWKNNPNPTNIHATFKSTLEAIRDDSKQQLTYMDETIQIMRSDRAGNLPKPIENPNKGNFSFDSRDESENYTPQQLDQLCKELEKLKNQYETDSKRAHPEETQLVTQLEEAQLEAQPEESQWVAQLEEAQLDVQPEEINLVAQPEETNLVPQPEEVQLLPQPEEVQLAPQPEEVLLVAQPEEVQLVPQPEEVLLVAQHEEIPIKTGLEASQLNAQPVESKMEAQPEKTFLPSSSPEQRESERQRIVVLAKIKETQAPSALSTTSTPSRRFWHKKPNLFCTTSTEHNKQTRNNKSSAKDTTSNPHYSHQKSRQSSSFFKTKSNTRSANQASPLKNRAVSRKENLWSHFNPIVTTYLKLLQENNLDFLYAQRAFTNSRKGKMIRIYVNCSEEKLMNIFENRPPLRFSVEDFGEIYKVRFISIEKLDPDLLNLERFKLPQKTKSLELIKTNNDILLQSIQKASKGRITASSEEGKIHTLQLQVGNALKKQPASPTNPLEQIKITQQPNGALRTNVAGILPNLRLLAPQTKSSDPTPEESARINSHP